jgi:hypothetical protein
VGGASGRSAPQETARSPSPEMIAAARWRTPPF